MSKAIPKVEKYMSFGPHSVGTDQTLRAASDLMRENRIRHLPVLNGGKLVGMISDRDLKFALSIEGVDVDGTLVGDIAQEEVYMTSPGSGLDEVVRNMAERRVGSAVVMDHNKVVGIFTATDALRALDHLLSTRLTH